MDGISCAVGQGPTWKTVHIAAFYSANLKFNSAQQNYPVHEIELVGGVEMMLRHSDILQGMHFSWVTDHHDKGLTHLLNQKNLSGRQVRWVKKINSFGFNFHVLYVPGASRVRKMWQSCGRTVAHVLGGCARNCSRQE